MASRTDTLHHFAVLRMHKAVQATAACFPAHLQLFLRQQLVFKPAVLTNLHRQQTTHGQPRTTAAQKASHQTVWLMHSNAKPSRAAAQRQSMLLQA